MQKRRSIKHENTSFRNGWRKAQRYDVELRQLNRKIETLRHAGPSSLLIALRDLGLGLKPELQVAA
jgi:hypothetical protein